MFGGHSGGTGETTNTAASTGTWGGTQSFATGVGGELILAPRLDEWLPLCDHGARGVDKDDFASLVFGFTQHRIVRLSDLRDITIDDLLKLPLKSVDGGEIQLHWGTANRLLRYVKADLLALDRASQAK